MAGGSLHRAIVGRKLRFVLRVMLLVSKPAIAGGFLQLGTGRLDEKEHGLEKSEWMVERVTSHDDSRAAMPFALVIEGELDFRAHPERPFCQETDSFGRPVNLILNQIDGIRKTNRHTPTLARP
jgi:hypothetical protein